MICAQRSACAVLICVSALLTASRAAHLLLGFPPPPPVWLLGSVRTAVLTGCNMDHRSTWPPYSVHFYFDKRSKKRWTAAVIESELSRIKFNLRLVHCVRYSLSIVLLHVNTVQLTELWEMIALLVNSVKCGSVAYCTLSGICNDVTQKQSGFHELLFSYHSIKSVSL
jgi:hypothetical protein